MRIQLPPPSVWEDFEFLALHLWKSIWADHNAQMHGRRGQSQAGVDVFGQPFGSSSWEGVQCKKKDRLSEAVVSAAELAKEAAKARSFVPALSAFALATTAPRDATIQAEANRLSSGSPFRVSVWSWDDIEDELNFRDYLIPKLYPQLLTRFEDGFGAGVLANRLYFFRTVPLERSLSFLSHPEIQSLFSSELRIDLRNLVFELSLNAFSHGAASYVGVTVLRDGSLELVDDGAPYNPMAVVPGADGVGLLYLRLFMEKYAGTFDFAHSRTEDGENRLVLALVAGARLNEAVSSRIVLFDDDALMPSRARYIAQTATIPTGHDLLELHISAMIFSPSSLFEFLRELFPRIPASVRIRVFCGAHDILARCLQIWASDAASPLRGRVEIVTDSKQPPAIE